MEHCVYNGAIRVSWLQAAYPPDLAGWSGAHRTMPAWKPQTPGITAHAARPRGHVHTSVHLANQQDMMHFSIPPVDFSLAQALQEKIDNKTKPVGSLGRLEEIAVRIGCIQHTLSPQLRDPHMLIFAGDHGAAHAGISAYPQDVSWQMLENYLKGGAAANVFSRLNGMTMLAIDAGVAHDFGPREGLIDAKIDPAGTRNYLEEPAMTRAQCLAAIAKGAEIARAVADRGCNIMGVGERPVWAVEIGRAHV